MCLIIAVSLIAIFCIRWLLEQSCVPEASIAERMSNVVVLIAALPFLLIGLWPTQLRDLHDGVYTALICERHPTTPEDQNRTSDRLCVFDVTEASWRSWLPISLDVTKADLAGDLGGKIDERLTFQMRGGKMQIISRKPDRNVLREVTEHSMFYPAQALVILVACLYIWWGSRRQLRYHQGRG